MIKNFATLLMKEKITILISSVILFFIITWSMSLSQPFKVEEKTHTPVVVKQGHTIVVCRKVTYLKEVDIKISRHLTRFDTELNMQRSISVGNVASTPRTSGVILLCRDVKIPSDLTVGTWTLWTHVEVLSFPWWTKTFKILPVKVNVIKGDTDVE